MSTRYALPHFQVTVKKRSGLPFLLRIVVTKKIKRAVDRNRIKRVLREHFRSKRGLLQERLVICRVHPTADKLKNAQIFQELDQFLP